MPSYLVETYLARRNAAERPARERRAQLAAEALTREGTRVDFERVIHVPEDETCFFVFDAPSALVAAQTAERAGLGAWRVVAVVSSGKETR